MADSKYDRQLQEMLATAGAILVRNKKHIIYRLPNGEAVPVSQTPSDWRASRKRIATLKHALVKKPDVPVEIPVEIAEEPIARERMVIPNWPAAGPAGEVDLPKLERLPAPPGAMYTPFGSVWDLRQHLAEMDDFWELTPSGRVRVLLKSLPANVKAEVVPMMFCRATVAEADLFGSSANKKSKQRDHLIEILMRRMHYTCGGGFYPAVYLHDPEEGDLLVDVASLSLLVDVWEDIQIVDLEEHRGFGMRVVLPDLWTDYVRDTPEEVDFITFMMSQFASDKGINFMTDEGWTNPSAIRHVVQAVRERHNPNFVPKPRPVVKQALTPFDQFKNKLVPAVRGQIEGRHLNDTDWLVYDVVTDPAEPLLTAVTLDWVGRVLAFGYVHEARNMARRLDGDTVELWLSFANDENRESFLEQVRAEGDCDPDDELAGFYRPESLECLKELRGFTLVFDSDQRARIQAVMESEPCMRAALLRLAQSWADNGNPTADTDGAMLRWH